MLVKATGRGEDEMGGRGGGGGGRGRNRREEGEGGGRTGVGMWEEGGGIGIGQGGYRIRIGVRRTAYGVRSTECQVRQYLLYGVLYSVLTVLVRSTPYLYHVLLVPSCVPTVPVLSVRSTVLY